MHFSSHHLTLKEINRIGKLNSFFGPVFMHSIIRNFVSHFRFEAQNQLNGIGFYWDMTTQIADDLIANMERMRVNKWMNEFGATV